MSDIADHLDPTQALARHKEETITLQPSTDPQHLTPVRFVIVINLLDDHALDASSLDHSEAMRFMNHAKTLSLCT